MDLNVGSVIAWLKLDTSKFDASLKTSQQTMQQFGKSMQRMGLYMTVGLTYPLYRFAKSAVKSFSAFNDAIIRSAAVTRGMTKEMRKEMEKAAIQMSKNSLFSATELAEGYFALGQAGYDAVQSIKILPIVEQFATAATIDLDSAIRYLARTAEGLGMAMETPVEMMKSMEEVSNVFTFAAITTTAEIQDFAIAMTHAAAPALKLVNKSMKEGISVLMAFARAGIVAEEAGTLLWTTVRDLQRANIKFRSQWKKLDIAVYDKVTRNMRNLADIFEDLEDKFANMSDEAKKASLQMLGFQDRSLRGIQALMGFSGEMKIFQKAMDKMGNLTERVANTYKKSFSAQMKMAKHNIEAVAISIGWMLSPILIKINEQIKRFATWWEALSIGAKFLIIQIVGLVAVLGPLLIISGKLLTTITYLSLGFKIAGWSVLGLAKSFVIVTLAASAWLAVIGIIAGVIYAAYAAWRQGMSEINERLLDLQNSFKWTFQYLKDTVGPFLIWMVETFHNTFGLIISDWDDFSADLAATFTSTWQWMKQVKEGIVDIWTDPWITWSQAAEKMKTSFRDAGNEWGQSFVKARDVAVKAIEEFKKEVMEGYETSALYTKAYIEGMAERMVELTEKTKKQFKEDFAFIVDLISAKIKMMNKNSLKLLPEEDMLEIVIALDKITKKIKELNLPPPPIVRWDKFLEAVADTSERSTDIAINAFTNLTDTIATQLERGKADWKGFVTVVLQEINRMLIGMMLAKTMFGEGSEGGGLIGFLKAGLMGAIGQGLSQDVASSVGPSSGMGSGGFGGSPQLFGLGAASGAAFNAGKVMAFASGGIVSQSTVAPMALMGEAGPEAIMPLTRTSGGELGVKAQQPIINVEPKIKINNIFDETEIIGAMETDAGEKVILNVLRRNNLL